MRQSNSFSINGSSNQAEEQGIHPSSSSSSQAANTSNGPPTQGSISAMNYNSLLDNQILNNDILLSNNNSSDRHYSLSSINQENHGQFPSANSSILIPKSLQNTGLNFTQSSQLAASKIFRYKSQLKNYVDDSNNDYFDIENNRFSSQSPYLRMKSCSDSPLLYGGIKSTRKIPKIPFKVLDAPNLRDDFYLNLVDWSAANYLAVGLGPAVYIWSACNSRVTKLCQLGNDQITSVSWSQRGMHLSVGTDKGETQIWDAVGCKKIRTVYGHTSRVGASSWCGSVLATGSRDRNILLRDIRSSEDSITKLIGHKQQVCGLKWSFSQNQLASGGNDNKLMVWSNRTTSSTSSSSVSNATRMLTNSVTQPLAKFSEHQAAVKAIGWSPHNHNLLASGGGTADRCIRFWNTQTLEPISCIDTGSQVCNLMFSKTVNQIVSTHGYSLNQIIVWQYPTMQKIATLTGHTYRVLYLSMSPDGQSVVTGAGDETLRFWNLFPSIKEMQGSYQIGSGGGDGHGGAGTGSIINRESMLYPSQMDMR